MRRTEQEFKEEVLKRTRAYRQKQAKTRKNILTASLCVCLCAVVLSAFHPFVARVDNAKMESVAMAPAAPMPEEAVGEDMVHDCAEDVISKVCIVVGDEEILMDDADAAIIRDYLTSDQWIMSAANCLCDYIIAMDGVAFRYHSDCGTIQDTTTGKSLVLEYADRNIFNSILVKYQK